MASETAVQDISSAVIEIAASVFEVAANELCMEASPETLDTWDSLNHLRLITAIETSFDVRLPMKTVLAIDTIEALVEAVENCRGK